MTPASLDMMTLGDHTPIPTAAGTQIADPQQSTQPELSTIQLVSAQCECCGLTEDCTPEYLSRVRDRHAGRWICGLCAEAVEEELFRPQRGHQQDQSPTISTEEAVLRHVQFCTQFRSTSPPYPTSPDGSGGDDLISAVVQLLRRSLSSPSSRSLPGSPMTRRGGSVRGNDGDGPQRPLGRSGSCMPTLAG